MIHIDNFLLGLTMIKYILLMTVLHIVPTHLEQFMCFVMIYSTGHMLSVIYQ